MACTTPEDVQVICPVDRETLRRLRTGGGWRRTCVWRERRWPNFIIWRWAGPAQAGWTPCPRKAPHLLLPRRRRRRPLTLMSPPRAGVPKAPLAPAAVPGRSRLPAVQRNGAARSRPAAVPRRAPAAPPNAQASRPSAPDGNPPARAPGSLPVLVAASLPVRAPDALPPRSGPRRVVGAAVSRAAPGPRRS
jgi:hypothetical protein